MPDADRPTSRPVETLPDGVVVERGRNAAGDLEAMLGVVKDALCADTATILLLDRSEQLLECAAVLGADHGSTWHGFRVPVGVGFAGRIARDRTVVCVDEVDYADVMNPAIREAGVHSLLGAPLVAGGHLLGVIHVGSREVREFTPDDRRYLVRASARVASSLGSADDDDALAGYLQRSLLPVPPALPAVPGLAVAGRYLPAEGDLGGDWHDVFPLPDGSIGMVIGDVVGHGVASAIIMSRIRSALRAYAVEHRDPAHVLELLDTTTSWLEPDTLATVAYLVVREPFREIEIATAGHPSPMVVAPGVPAHQLDLPGEPPIGVGWLVARTTTRVQLPEGASICLFTDGLVERRPARYGMADQLSGGLRTLLASFGPEDPEVVCDRILGSQLTQMVGALEDDIALLVARAA